MKLIDFWYQLRVSAYSASHLQRAVQPFVMEKLEPRILLSADPVSAFAGDDGQPLPQELQSDLQVSQQIEAMVTQWSAIQASDTPTIDFKLPDPIALADFAALDKADSDSTAGQQSQNALSQFELNDVDKEYSRQEIIFFDPATPDYETLLADIAAASTETDYRIFILQEDRDGLAQIGRVLENFNNLDAIHIISHGNAAGLSIGTSTLDQTSLDSNASSISNWNSSLNSDADIMLYGCNLAATSNGQQLIQELSELTGADVAASNDLTGSNALGGDWELEHQVGDITTKVAVSDDAQRSWKGVLATTTVTNNLDSINGNTGSIDALNANDGGDGISLREAIQASNNTDNGGIPNTIDFNISGSETITPSSALPEINRPVVIDGTTDPDFVDRPVVRVDGSFAGSEDGFDLRAGDTTIKGLSITNWGSNGISINANGGNTVVGNHIGVGTDGTEAMGNGIDGVYIDNIDNNIIGGTSAADRNVIGDNGDEGVDIVGSNAYDNIIQGNYIGLDWTGNNVLGNGTNGVYIQNGADDNIIGGTAVGARNIISGNLDDGIEISGNGSTGNIIQGNYIGTNVSGTVDLGNGDAGIFIEGAKDNQIGGTTASARNIIAGNDGAGIEIAGSNSTGNSIQGNYIGLAVGGNVALANSGAGILLTDDSESTSGESSYNIIGGSVAGAGNVISANATQGIKIESGSHHNDVLGNYIGTNAAGNTALGNQHQGIRISSGAHDNSIGGTGSLEGNVIAASGGSGLMIEDADTDDNTVLGNLIGTDITGTLNLANTAQGILITGGAGSNVVGSTASGGGNTIAFNAQSGIRITDANSIATIRGNSIHSNAGLGIDLDGDGVTANDALDADSGPNYLKNFPIITSVTVNGSNVAITGTVHSGPNWTLDIDFYYNTTADATGYGEGQHYIGSASVNTDGSGNASFQFNFSAPVAIGNAVSSTLGDAYGFSEFSQNYLAVANNTPTGAISIVGTALVDEVLSVDTGALSDADGLGTLSYQWQRDGVDIVGATASTYQLISVDAGALITVKASYTDNLGMAETVMSGATAAVTEVANTLWITTTGDVNSHSGGDAGSITSWTNEEIIQLGGSGFELDPGTTAGSLTSRFDVNNFTGSDTEIRGIHYVNSALTIGNLNTVNLEQGDLLLALEGSQTLTNSDTSTLDVNEKDIFVFRPDDPGDYTAGTFIKLADNINGQHIHGFSLVENDTLVGDTTLQAGTLLLSTNGGDYDKRLLLFTPDDLNSISAADIDILIDGKENKGSGEIINKNIRGIELIENTFTLGDITLTSGSILLSTDKNASVLDNLLDAKRQDIFALDIDKTTRGSGTTVGTASLLFDGSDIGFSDADHNINSLTIYSSNSVPEGTVSITGTTTEDQTLTASNTLTDADGLGAITYQWLRDGDLIAGATNSTYTLGDADVGSQISVEAAYTDGKGNPESLTSDPTAAVSNINDSPTGTVTISGTVTENNTLTASNTLADADGLGSINYQWQRDGADISGATNTTHLLTDADVGTAITVVASYADTQGSDETIASTATAAVSNVNDTPTGTVTISGTTSENQTLTASNSLTDDDGIGTISYQWQRNGSDIAGATNTSYTLGDADVGNNITVVASYTDGHAELESVASSATAAISNVNDAVSGTVTISGTVAEDQTLVANTAALADNDGLGTFSYQWHRDGTDITGATANSYILDDADVGESISLTVSFTDGQGTVESVTSAATAAVNNVNDIPMGSVTITGSNVENQVLTASNSLADNDGIGTISYQWQRNGANITGETFSNYTLIDADVGQNISVVASYTDALGTAENISSLATASIVNVDDDPSGLPGVLGSATQGQNLTINTSGISDDDGLGAFSYQWLRNGGVIGGATANNYTLGAADVGAVISITVSFTDGHGSPESITSLTTATVSSAANNLPTGSVLLSGIASENEQLSVTNSLNDPDGLGTISYQWRRDSSDIAGATGTNYTLVDADVGSSITVLASYTDGLGSDEQIISNASAIIASVNDTPQGAVTINGTTVEDQTLTVTDTLSDEDGLGTFNYQWLRNGAAIAAATGTSFTLDDIDVGTLISVSISYTDGDGSAESVSSATTPAISNVNDAPAGTVSIAGSATEKQVLTASHNLSDDDGLGTINYQWRRDSVDIAGATAANYTLSNADVGAIISVDARYTDGHGSLESISSANTSAINNINDSPSGSVIIQGNTVEDSLLTASNTLADADGLGTVSYQWLREGSAISGATSSNYLLGDDDVNKVISVIASYTDDQGTQETVNSNPTSAISNINDNPEGAVFITGDAFENEILTAGNSLSDNDGLGTISYQWQRDGVAISGATGETYRLVNPDAGTQISVTATYIDNYGTSEIINSEATAAIGNINNTATGEPVIVGNITERDTLSADTSAIADEDGLGELSYQWMRNDSEIDRAINSSYVLVSDDVGLVISVTVSFVDAQGSQETLFSTTTAPINAAPNTDPTGTISISGAAVEDRLLVAENNLTDTDGMGDIDYQWFRNGEAISGANSEQYRLDDLDVGATLSVLASYTDGLGNEESVASESTATITNINDQPSGFVSIRGDAVEDQTLNISNNLVDADGISVLEHQWRRDDVNIAGANGSSYTLTDADVGASMTVAVSYNDNHGARESVVSAPTATVANVNDLPQGDVLIQGAFSTGSTLLISADQIQDQDGLGEPGYQWMRNGINITGAVEDSYTLTIADAGQQISVVLHYTDQHGQAEALYAPPVAIDTISEDTAGIILAAERLRTFETTTAGENVTSPSVSENENADDVKNNAGDSNSENEKQTEKEAKEAKDAKDSQSENNSATESEEDAQLAESTTAGVPASNIDWAGGIPSSTQFELSLNQTSGNVTFEQVVSANDLSSVNNSYTGANSHTNLNSPENVSFMTRLSGELASFVDPMVLTDTSGYKKGLDNMRDVVIKSHNDDPAVIGGTVTVTAGLSVGYVIWIARSGVLLSTALSSLPAWRFVDPLPVLSQGKGGFGLDFEEDDESLESIVEQETVLHDKAHKPVEQQGATVDPSGGP